MAMAWPGVLGVLQPSCANSGKSGEESEAAQIVFGPAGGLQNAPKGFARECIAAGVVVDAGQAAVGVAIDPAAGAGLALQ